MKIFAAAVATTLIALAASPQARAVGLLETRATNAAGNCQAALPAFEGLIRKRPLAVVNEGDVTAFVTCAFTTSQLALGISGYQARLTNIGTTPQTVNCTGVTGEESNATYFTKTMVLSPGTSQIMSYTNILDNLGVLFTNRLSFSCSLPPLVGLNNNSVTSVLSII